MKKCVYLTVLVASILLTIHLFGEARRLQDQVQKLEEERKRAALAAISVGRVGISEDEQERMLGIYREIARAYTNRDIMAMRIAMLKLPPVNDHLSWEIIPQIEKPLFVAFKNSFLMATALSDFDVPSQFEKYIKANTEVALFFGGVCVRRKDFEGAAYYESKTIYILRQYEKKFNREGKDELRDIVTKELAFWSAWIESPNGFTRQFANHEFSISTEYAKIVKPERAMSREKAAKHAYSVAVAFLRPTGYTPAWLSEYAAKKPTAP